MSAARSSAAILQRHSNRNLIYSQSFRWNSGLAADILYTQILQRPASAGAWGGRSPGRTRMAWGVDGHSLRQVGLDGRVDQTRRRSCA